MTTALVLMPKSATVREAMRLLGLPEKYKDTPSLCYAVAPSNKDYHIFEEIPLRSTFYNGFIVRLMEVRKALMCVHLEDWTSPPFLPIPESAEDLLVMWASVFDVASHTTPKGEVHHYLLEGLGPRHCRVRAHVTQDALHTLHGTIPTEGHPNPYAVAWKTLWLFTPPPLASLTPSLQKEVEMLPDNNYVLRTLAGHTSVWRGHKGLKEALVLDAHLFTCTDAALSMHWE